MVYKIDSKDNNVIYNELEEAKQNLYKDGCANKNNDDGKSKEAEKLEEEIKKLQEKQKNNSDMQDNQNNNNDNENDEYETPNVEDELKDKERQANESRQDDMQSSENIGSFSYYNGRRW